MHIFYFPNPTPLLLVPLFIAPFLAFSVITAYLHSHLHSAVSRTSSPHINPPTNSSIPENAFPENGFPPPRLPPSHRNFHLLNTIRTRSQLTPRWPSRPGMHAVALRSYGPAYASIIISEKLKVIYIPVFKVATTSVMWHIAYLENNPHVLNKIRQPGALASVLHDMSSPAWENHTIFKRSIHDIQRFFEDPSYLKFGFVRNPFHRIISAYVDKIVTWPIESSEYQKQMWSLYGNEFTKRAEANISKPSFRDFLQGAAEVLRMPRTPSADLHEKGAYEDNTSRRDIHWRPQVELLHPDLIHLDFVGRFENIGNDLNVVLEWMYRHTNRRMPLERRGKLHATDPRDKIQLYKMLRHDEALQKLVVHMYRRDFETFHFSKVPEGR